MKFGDYLDDIARATGFLSRLPMPARHFEEHDGTLSRAVAMFPLAGLVIGLAPGLAVLLLSWVSASSALAALLALTLLIAITGALHEDGLADSADAFGARGGRDHMLEIMKDSRIGAYGVLALMVTFSLRATALTVLLAAAGGWNGLLALLAVAAISRTAMVWHWNELPPARLDGVAKSAGAPEAASARLAMLLGGGVFVVLAALSCGLLTAAIALAISTAAARLWTARVQTRLDGHTGDTIGATQQITETGCLVTLALLV
jgi:adenosylcobinamide-GDP ribazoletransferase